MKTIDLIKGTLANVLNHWRQAIQIFAISSLATLCLFAVFSKFGVQTRTIQGQDFSTPNLLILVVIPCICILMLWPVVAWHRLLILGEKPTGPLPTFSFKPMMNYALKLVMISIIIAVLSLPALLILMPILAGSIDAGAILAGERMPLRLTIVPIIATLPATYVALRSCLALPGAAIGSDVGISTSFVHTSPHNSNILGLTLLSGVISIVVQLCIQAIVPPPMEITATTNSLLSSLSTAGQVISSFFVMSLMSEMFRAFVPEEDKEAV